MARGLVAHLPLMGIDSCYFRSCLRNPSVVQKGTGKTKEMNRRLGRALSLHVAYLDFIPPLHMVPQPPFHTE